VAITGIFQRSAFNVQHLSSGLQLGVEMHPALWLSAQTSVAGWHDFLAKTRMRSVGRTEQKNCPEGVLLCLPGTPMKEYSPDPPFLSAKTSAMRDKLNLGCGRKHLPDASNLDLVADTQPNIVHDLNVRPFRPDAVMLHPEMPGHPIE
jgi:hypothetical protein